MSIADRIREETIRFEKGEYEEGEYEWKDELIGEFIVHVYCWVKQLRGSEWYSVAILKVCTDEELESLWVRFLIERSET